MSTNEKTPSRYYVFIIDGPAKRKVLHVHSKTIIEKLALGFTFRYTHRGVESTYELVQERSLGSWTARQAVERDASIRVERERREIEAKAKEAERVAALPPTEQKQYRERKHQRYMARANMLGMLLALSERGRRT